MRRHDNGWGYRVDLGPDPATGKRRQVSKQGFRTKREAEQAAAQGGGGAEGGAQAEATVLEDALEAMGRAGAVEELDGPLLLLASDAGRFMTGSVVTVDGGHLLAMG